ncbi:carboxypeptidase B-like [Bicyclus anynana]|uniref:Carboxypeptidase B-like n=1 Tax=Bicyclus anynana TaxID=110368 RepID=A0ABM3LJ66_BICAN|nr:carboxypeptidase B-like [Bicyclus anynana]
MLSPENRVEAFDILDASDMKHYLHVADVAKAIEEHERDLSRWQSSRTSLVPFQKYPTYDEVNEYLERIAREYPNYVTYSVHGVQLRGRSDQRVLYELQTELNVDLWEHGAPGQRDASIMVSPENLMEVFEILDANDMKHYLQIRDVAKSLEERDAELSRWQQSRQTLQIFQTYARHDAINEYMERIANQYPNIAQVVDMQKSFEGRDIKYLKISTTNFTNPSKPIYFMDATMHAREWVTTTVTLYSIHRLVEDLREEDRYLLENVDWIIMPVVNPDGYEFSHTDNRLWRGTRSVNETTNAIHNRTCIGVDPNRNFDVNFNTLGVSSDPCFGTYPGHEAFSEVETRNIRDILSEYIDRLQIYMDIHSFGNYVLYGMDNATLPYNVVHQHYVAAAMGAQIDAVKLPKAPFYAVGNSNLMLYGTSGAASDYAYVVGVPMSYTLELPGYGYQFQVPPEYIDQINMETWKGIAATGRLAALYYNAKVKS